MKFVDQTKIGPEGNCFDACIASLLEIPIEEVNYGNSEETWYPDFQRWLEPRGLFYLEVLIKDVKPFPLFRMSGIVVIGCGPSPRDIEHAVLGHLNGYKFDLLFDPHPSRAGLKEVRSFGFLSKRFGNGPFMF